MDALSTAIDKTVKFTVKLEICRTNWSISAYAESTFSISSRVSSRSSSFCIFICNFYKHTRNLHDRNYFGSIFRHLFSSAARSWWQSLKVIGFSDLAAAV